MSNTKHLADLLKVCSILPALAIMPAMADLPNTTGNAWVFGDLNLNYDTANNSAIGGRVSVLNGERGNDFPNYNVVGRSVNLTGTADKRTNVYVGPVNMTLRELQADEAFSYNWQKPGTGESNWDGEDLRDGEVSYADFDIAKEKNILWGDDIQTVMAKNGWTTEEYLEMAAGLSFFANRDATKTAGALATENVDLTLDGTKVAAGSVTLSKSTMNVVKLDVPANILNGVHNASDGVSKIVADKFTAKDNSRILVGAGAELDLTGAKDVLFTNNVITGNGEGGAIYNLGDVKIAKAEFEDNKASVYGGAISNRATMTIQDAKFEENISYGYYGGAIYNAGKGVIDSLGADFSGNKVAADGFAGGGAIANIGKIGNLTGAFYENKVDAAGDGASAKGAAIYTYAGSSINSVVSDFMSNQTLSDGEAIGGAVVNDGKITKLHQSGKGFVNNTSDGVVDGWAGALYNSENALISELVADFAGNKVIGGTRAFGGALVNKGTIESLTGNFTNNSAIATAKDGEVFGGAIYNGGDMTIAQSAFNANIAGQNGGAIYNYGTMDLGEAGSTFDDNIASIAGGAIYNTGDLTIKNGDFENNRITSGNGDGGALYTNTGALTLVDTDFSENYTKENAEGDMGYGGAIFAQGGTIDIQGGEYEDNHALTGGAIYVSKSATSVNIENVEFEGNWASDIGALGIFGKNTTLTNLTFTDNYTTGQYKDFGFNDGGGALFFGSEAQAVLDNGVFLSNESAGVGGAIATRSPNKGDNSAAKLDIKNSTFSENVAKTNGGAIYTAFYNSESAVEHAYVTDSKFVANKANNGAAIYNEGLADRGDNFAAIKLNNVTFIDNVAETQGGAIYNGAGGTVVLSGNNMFSGNTAGKYGALNDIHNLGTLNIVSGETTISGGVSGTGELSLAQDAKLDIGNATIVQSVIDLQGTVIASALNSRDFGRFVGDVTVGGSAKFQLNVGAVGTYKIWGDATVLESQVSVGDIYEVASIDGQGVTIVTKSVETIAQDKGISTQAAGAVAGLANSNNGKAHQVSLALQDALDAGDAQYVEQETAKLNPDNKPVVQSVSSAMQNQVLSLTAGRMAGVMPMGRAGGDAPQENGFWVQGLFNKSKFADQFHGYTRGVAVGADTLIDRKWTIGGGLAFNNSDVHADGRHTEIDSKTLFLYGQYKPSKWFVNATATYSMSEYTENQQAGGVDWMSTYDVDAYGAQVMTGYDFATGITTEVGARYLHIAQDDYVDGLDTQIMATDTNFLSGVAGLKYAFAIENDWAVKLRPELRAAMTYDFISDDSASTVTMPGVEAYAVNGNRLSRMGGEFGLGLTATYKGMEVSVMYDLDLHQDYTSQTGMLKFRGRF